MQTFLESLQSLQLCVVLIGFYRCCKSSSLTSVIHKVAAKKKILLQPNQLETTACDFCHSNF